MDWWAIKLNPVAKGLCIWCYGALRGQQRSCCGRPQCKEGIRCAYDWGHVRRVVHRRDKTCRLCGSWFGREVDHIVPVSLGGTGDLTNLRLLCCECHKVETARLRRYGDRYLARQVIGHDPCMPVVTPLFG